MVLFRNTPFFDIFGLIMFLLFGVKLKGVVEVISGDKFDITSSELEQFNTDGESSYKTNSISVRVIKESLEIYVGRYAKNKYF